MREFQIMGVTRRSGSAPVRVEGQSLAGVAQSGQWQSGLSARCLSEASDEHARLT